MPENYTDRPLLTDDFDRALLLATSHHRRQLRKGGSDTPYVAHLLAVTSLVLEMGGSQTEAIGALLHDAVEDRGGPHMLEKIRQEFGEDVARIVKANSDTDEEPKPPWPERKRAYIAAIATKKPDELRVSLADKLHNARGDPARLSHRRRRAVEPLQPTGGRAGAPLLPRVVRRVHRARR